MTERTLPGQLALLDAGPAPSAPPDWRFASVRWKRIVHMMLETPGASYTLLQIRQRVGGSDTGNSAAMRRLRKEGYELTTKPGADGVVWYRLQKRPA